MTITWEQIVESNIINFTIFAIVIVWGIWRYLITGWQNKNQDLIAKLAEAQLREKQAQDSLKQAEKKLKDWEIQIVKMQEEQNRIIAHLRQELESNNHKKLIELEQKYQRQLDYMQNIAQNKIRNLILNGAINNLTQEFQTNTTLEQQFTNNAIAKISKK